MVTLRSKIIVSILFVCGFFNQQAVEAHWVGIPGYPLHEEVVTNATSAAMGGTSLGLFGHLDIGYLHPAGLAFLASGGISGNYLNRPENVKYYRGGVGLKLGERNTLAAFYRTVQHNVQVSYTSTPYSSHAELRTLTSSFNETSLAFARKLLPSIGVSAQLHYAWRHGSGWSPYRDTKNTLDKMALSVGGMLYPDWNDLVLALSYRHIPFKSDYSRSTGNRARVFRASAAIDAVQLIGMDIYWPHTRFLVTGDRIYYQEERYRDRKRIGVEYGYRDMLFLRAGYYFEEGCSNRANWSKGIGLRIPAFGLHFQLEYAYRDLIIMDPLHWYSLSINW